jgi:hypothetical protein
MTFLAYLRICHRTAELKTNIHSKLNAFEDNTCEVFLGDVLIIVNEIIQQSANQIENNWEIYGKLTMFIGIKKL